ncbi:MAG TPA: SusC/RagA family TonB-linked outer membrane protein [Niabella sp.]|nr:SusC/RagA family TonB-linked outer membrane protein [Niabella sp.]HQW14857.1 SusC/RagA family TonB-linked outer membrane protein [Niabella sp.]HQX18518.1 SusC/RagA family TonB-linked outer membrane protein [Niabella sp.]HQX41831.1 SusC/RagA family TonB-linked outer membrane protein [Niabella sp.]HRB06045.1 SusC/RagA family TonB-linked outer membrane protein [Niabella sp.]
MRKTTASFILCWLSCLLIPGLAFAQSRSINGVVETKDGKPIQGVTVSVNGTARATSTEQDGTFNILIETGQTLEFSSIGYETQSRRIGNENTIRIVMVEGKGTQEDEVIVTAYGQTKGKRGLTYQAQQLKGDEIAETQRDNWVNGLIGRVAGANITPSSGAPGASTTIVLRGPVSLGGNNQPLFVVDGVPYDNQTINQDNLLGNSSGANRNSDYGNRAADINSNDIETITILKGPEASALYGSEGASGAIVITTKKGKSGRAVVSYDNSFRFENIYRFPEIQTVYTRGSNGISDLTSTGNPFSSGTVYQYFGDKYPEGTKIYDNARAFFRTGKSQRHNLNLDGGSNVATYRLSVSYRNQEGVVPMTGDEQISTKLTGGVNITPKMKLTTSLAYTNIITDKATKGAGGYLYNLINFPSDIDVTDWINPDGTRKLYRQGNASLSAEFDNPFWDVNKNRSQDKIDRTSVTANYTFNIAKWISLLNNFGVDYYSQTGFSVVHPLSRAGFSLNGTYSLYEQVTRNISNNTSLNFNKSFGKFNNSLIAGMAFDNRSTKIESQKGERFFERDFYSILNTDPISRDAKTVQNVERLARWFANYSFDFNRIFYVSLAGSREGNSKLVSRAVDKDPYYNFGSASSSLIFSDIGNVKKSLPWLSFGKLRVSYGTTGKGPYRPYIIDNSFSGQISTGGGFAYDLAAGNNYSLQPEFTKNFEFGGELRFFKDRISLDVTRYDLRSDNQIIAARYSYGSGFAIRFINGGLVSNKGIETILNVKAIQSKNFKWDVTANFDRNRGEVLEMPGGLPTYYDSDTWVFGNMRSQMFVGASPYNLASYTVVRNNNGDVVISPTTGLPATSNNFMEVGDRQVDYKVGLINNFNYKNFNLSFNIEFRKGGDVWNGMEYYLFLTGLSKKTLSREEPIVIKGVLNDGLQNSTTPTPNTIVIVPFNRNDYYTSSSSSTEADFIENVNWMRMRDATLSYNIPAKVLTKTKFISSASVFVTGTELFMITNYTGMDPSVNANNASSRGAGGVGIDFGALSMPRGINFGVRVRF